jgi:hypothetical protein
MGSPFSPNAENPHRTNMVSTFNPFGVPASSATPTCPFLVASKGEVNSALLDPSITTTSPSAESQPLQGEQHMEPSNNFNAENAITLLVGPEKQKLIVHASYITRTSAFFATALKKEWTEGQTRTIELHEETPEMMAHYLDWVYTSKLPTKDCGLFHPESAKIAAHDLLAELYVLGEHRLDFDFRNAITAEFVRLRLILHICLEERISLRPERTACQERTHLGTGARRLTTLSVTR